MQHGGKDYLIALLLVYNTPLQPYDMCNTSNVVILTNMRLVSQIIARVIIYI